MPRITQDELINSIDPRDDNLNQEITREPPHQPEDHTLSTVFGAAFRQENIIGSFFGGGFTDTEASDPNYDPFDRLTQLGREDLFEQGVFSDSEDELQDMIKRVDKERSDRQILAESGWTGTVASMTAGVADPTLLIPGAAVVRAGTKMVQVARGVATGAALGTAAATSQEAMLQATQVDRDKSRLVTAAVAGAIVGGALGGAVGAMTKSAKGGQELAVKLSIDESNPNMFLDAEGTVTADAGISSVGAMRADPTLSMAELSKVLKEEEGIQGLNQTLTKTLSSPIRALRSPVVNGLTSTFGTMKKATNMFFEHNFILNKNIKGEKTGASVEGLGKQDEASAVLRNDKINKLYIKSVGLEGNLGAEARAAVGGLTKGKMSYQQFSEEVAYAMRRDDVHAIPEVAEASKLLRKDMDDVVVRLQKMEILPEDLTVKTARSYLTRRYNVGAINAPGGREELAGILARNFAKKADVHVSSPDVVDSVEKTVNNILGIGDQAIELDNVASDMLSTGGRFKKERVLDIDDSEIEKFLVNDGIALSQAYLHQANSIIRFQEVLQREGFDNLTQMRKALRDESNAIAKNKGVFDPTTAKITNKKLAKELKIADEEMVKSARVVLGQFGRGTNSLRDNALKTLRKYQTLRLLGGMALSALPDAAMPFFKHGPLAVARDGILPMLRNFKKSKISKDELADFNVGLELMQNEILRAMTDGDFAVLAGKSRLQSIGDHAVQNFGKLTLNSYWTKAGKRLGGQMSVSRTFRALKTLNKGGNISDKESTRLASLGIGPEDYAKIWGEFEKHGQEEAGSFISNFGQWNKDIREMFGAAVSKDVDSTILTPGRGDIPFLAQQSEATKTIFQFKSFTSTATNKILLSGLQRRDANALSGMAMMVMLGGMSWMLKGAVSGKDVAGDAIDDDTLLSTFLSEGISRSGVAGLMGDMSFALNPYSSNSRYRGLNTSSYLGGPSWNLVQDIYKAAEPLIPSSNKKDKNGMTSADWKKVSRMLPYQNLFWMRSAWNNVNK